MTNADEPSDSGMTMLSILQESHDRRKQKLHLKELFQQAYFWSRTKKKSICNNILSEKKQEAIEIKKVKKIKSNLTFQNYIKNRSSKELFSQRKCQIGSNMITNKSRILEIEQEGSKQQLLLKRCLEDAIEQCCKVKVEGKKPKAKAEQTMFKMW